MNHFCRQASRLASDRLDRRLRWGERVRLGLHLAMCGLCRRNARALLRIHRVVSGAAADEERWRLDEARRRRIAEGLPRE
ncbi:MAG: zf-HC2 domain-containing protein [Zetaproteobacteria bacterium]|nr:MAG: zf-HC2 domain-containing protein [Zetaproteobacteria bacterium]